MLEATLDVRQRLNRELGCGAAQSIDQGIRSKVGGYTSFEYVRDHGRYITCLVDGKETRVNYRPKRGRARLKSDTFFADSKQRAQT